MTPSHENQCYLSLPIFYGFFVRVLLLCYSLRKTKHHNLKVKVSIYSDFVPGKLGLLFAEKLLEDVELAFQYPSPLIENHPRLTAPYCAEWIDQASGLSS